MTDVDKRLENIETKIDRLADAIEAIAVQKEKIECLEIRMNGIWERYDGIAGVNGIIAEIRNHQASCPRSQVRWMWAILIPMGLTLLGIATALLKEAA